MPTLEVLAASTHEVVRVVTRPPVPAGRGSQITPTPVAVSAHTLGLPLSEVETVKSGPGLDLLLEDGVDLLIVVAYGELLPAELLRAPRIAAVNLHFSLLPDLRGPAPVQRAILNGDRVTGVTTMLMSQGLDTGDLLMQVEEAISPEDDAGSLGERLAHLGAGLIVPTLDGLLGGTLVKRPQDERLATYAPKLDSRNIDWSGPAVDIVNFVRALSPRPGASTIFRGRILKVFRAELSDRVEEAALPGCFEDEAGPSIGAGSGAVRLLEVGPEGRKRMSGRDFARGYHPAVGEKLGLA